MTNWQRHACYRADSFYQAANRLRLPIKSAKVLFPILGRNIGGVPRLYAQSYNRRRWSLYDLVLDRVQTEKYRFYLACRDFVSWALPERELPLGLFRCLSTNLNWSATQRLQLRA